MARKHDSEKCLASTKFLIASVPKIEETAGCLSPADSSVTSTEILATSLLAGHMTATKCAGQSLFSLISLLWLGMFQKWLPLVGACNLTSHVRTVRHFLIVLCRPNEDFTKMENGWAFSDYSVSLRFQEKWTIFFDVSVVGCRILLPPPIGLAVQRVSSLRFRC